MLEIQRSHAAIVACHASAAALDALPLLPGVASCRVAPDELLLLAAPSRLDELLRWARARLTSAEAGPLVLDQSDGWAIFSLRGDDELEALRKLSLIPFPEARPAFVQGAVAGGSAKLLLLKGVVHLLVPFPLRDHLERRLRDVCAAATTRIGSGELPFASAAEAVPVVPPPAAGCDRRRVDEPRSPGLSRPPTPHIQQHEQALDSSYDVVIVGGGGHGLATAYYLAREHGVRKVAVLERSYIGSGGTGRNTTVLRANYKTPETIRFYQASFELYRTLAEELDFNMLRSQRGLLWLAHSEAQLNSQRERALQNQVHGVDTVFMTPSEVARACPQLDMSCGGQRPILGAAYHAPGSIIRHDGVVWGYATAAQRLGVQVHQGVEVEGVILDNGRCTGVRTNRGTILAGAVLSAVGGYVTQITDMLGLKLPIVTHPLQAFVTQSYKPVLDRVVASADLHIYISQSARGELLVGAEIDPYTSYSTRSTFPFVSSCASRAIDLFPFMAKLHLLRQWSGVCDMTPDYSPLLGTTPVAGFFLSSGWGTWGFKAIPIAGKSMAALIASGRVPAVIAPFALDRFRRDRCVPERASAGTH